MKKQRVLYNFVAISLIMALAYIQAIQFTHGPHSPHPTEERIEASTQLTKNSDISCLICYFLQHNSINHFHLPSQVSDFYYLPAATTLFSYSTAKAPSTLIQGLNNKSPPSSILFS